MTPDAIITSTQSAVATILADRFPDHLDFGDGTFAIPHGSSSVSIVVRSYTETDAVIDLTAQVVSEANITAEITKWLLRKNAEIHMGSFGLLFDDTIIYSYSLSAREINADTLESAITSVAVIADHYDDEIVEKIGGKRVVDT